MAKEIGPVYTVKVRHSFLSGLSPFPVLIDCSDIDIIFKNIFPVVRKRRRAAKFFFYLEKQLPGFPELIDFKIFGAGVNILDLDFCFWAMAISDFKKDQRFPVSNSYPANPVKLSGVFLILY